MSLSNPKWKTGSLVEVRFPNGRELAGEIVSFDWLYDKYEVQWLDIDLMPRTMDIPEDWIFELELGDSPKRSAIECECGYKGKKVPKEAHARWCPKGK